MARRTGGLIPPTLLTALEAAGYDPHLRRATTRGRVAAPAAGTGPRRLARYRISFAHPHGARAAGVRLDFGGIAKGWAAEQAARRLGRHAAALVDAGGDIALSGPRQGANRGRLAWRTRSPPTKTSRCCASGVAWWRRQAATTGAGGRAIPGNIIFWTRAQGHPRRHRRVERDGDRADGSGSKDQGKAALILGSQEGLDWIEARPALAGLLVLDNGEVLSSRRLPHYRWG